MRPARGRCVGWALAHQCARWLPRRRVMVTGLGGLKPTLLAVVITMSDITSYTTAAPGENVSCANGLTFRWTSGDPIRLDVSRPVAASLANPPFLRDPEILSVSQDRDRFGARLTIKLGPVAGKVLAAQSEAHLKSQMLIMSGDTLIIATMVLGPLGDVIVLRAPEDRLNDTLKALTSGPTPHQQIHSETCEEP